MTVSRQTGNFEAGADADQRSRLSQGVTLAKALADARFDAAHEFRICVDEIFSL
jgi:hypothetical protein